MLSAVLCVCAYLLKAAVLLGHDLLYEKTNRKRSQRRELDERLGQFYSPLYAALLAHQVRPCPERIAKILTKSHYCMGSSLEAQTYTELLRHVCAGEPYPDRALRLVEMIHAGLVQDRNRVDRETRELQKSVVRYLSRTASVDDKSDASPDPSAVYGTPDAQ